MIVPQSLPNVSPRYNFNQLIEYSKQIYNNDLSNNNTKCLLLTSRMKVHALNLQPSIVYFISKNEIKNKFGGWTNTLIIHHVVTISTHLERRKLG